MLRVACILHGGKGVLRSIYILSAWMITENMAYTSPVLQRHGWWRTAIQFASSLQWFPRSSSFRHLLCLSLVVNLLEGNGIFIKGEPTDWIWWSTGEPQRSLNSCQSAQSNGAHIVTEEVSLRRVDRTKVWFRRPTPLIKIAILVYGNWCLLSYNDLRRFCRGMMVHVPHCDGSQQAIETIGSPKTYRLVI